MIAVLGGRPAARGVGAAPTGVHPGLL